MKTLDKIPKTYDRKIFTLDGMMDLDISFDGLTMRTPVYIKLDALEQLLRCVPAAEHTILQWLRRSRYRKRNKKRREQTRRTRQIRGARSKENK